MRYSVTIEAVIVAKSDKKLAKILNRMLDAGGDAVEAWEPESKPTREDADE